jgi:hypothetical protein
MMKLTTEEFLARIESMLGVHRPKSRGTKATKGKTK